ncbi:MAG: Cation/multidrug efflux pump [Armatimonadetes bacterium]|jgi:HAE1 family hydrophobic/amphiphilic exporter-1|nr:Cation/multidrug efflux pump [Armatimonadota bacterium]
MWLTRLSIQRPVFVVVLITTLLIVGLFSRSKMLVEERPRVDIPYVTITTTYPGTGPAEMESLITKPLEDAVSSVNGIRNITSSSQYGISFVQLEFFIGTNSQFAAQEVRQKVDGTRKTLPRDIDPPVVDRFDINSQPVLYLGMKGERPIKQLRFLADTQIKYRLAQVPGVGQVEVTGGDVREIRISVNKDRLEAWNMSITDVVSAIYRANANVPSGHVTEGPRDYDARLVGEFQSVEQITNLDLPLTFGQTNVPLKLRDVATVTDTVAERQTVTRIWTRDHPGKPMVGADSVGVTVTKLADANTIEVVDGIKKELERIEKTMPGNLQFMVVQDESRTVRNSLEDINVSLILGALLAVIVVFLFLHNLRGTLICAIAIPTSLIAAFIPMYFLGQSLNNMTMLGLSLVVGILVDDSIVVLESIYRHLYKGETPMEAALNGRGEIGNAAIIITLVDVVVFLPMLWMGGIIGMFLKAFGLTVALATLFSLLVSFTVTPWLASRWYRLGEDLEHKTGFFLILDNGLHALDRGYRKVLDWVLGTPRWFSVVVAVGLVVWLVRGGLPNDGASWSWFWMMAVSLAMLVAFIAAGWWSTAGRMAIFSLGTLFFVFTMQVFFPLMKIGYIPVYDQSRLGLTLELPAGASLEQTDSTVRKMEEIVADTPEVAGVFTTVGKIQGGGRGAPETGRQFSQLNIQLYEKPDLIETINPWANKEKRAEDWRKRTDAEIAGDIRKRIAGIPGGKAVVIPVRGFSGISAPVQVELLGFDLVQMKRVAEQVRDKLAKVPGVINPDISLRPGKPEAQVTIDRNKAAQYGLDVTAIGLALRSSYEGNIDAKFREQGEQFDIRVQFAELDRSRIDELGSIVVGRVNADGGRQAVRLNQVANITMGEGPNKIERKNRLRKATVSAYVLPGVVAVKVNNQIEAEIKKMTLGDIKVSAGGDADRARTEYPHLMLSLVFSFVLVYLLMAVLFDNLIHPLTIQLSLPMAMIGAVLGLVWMDQQLSIISITGFIMLGGIVQKNAILLIDYINTLRGRGYERDAAIKESGPTRLRPILMTTLAMIAGMAPVAMAVGRGNEARAPLATAVIGGLLMSTVLSLLIIPCIYSVFDDIQEWVGRLMNRGKRSWLVENALAEEGAE